MDRVLTVKHTADRRGRPLACIQSLPGDGAEFSAAQLRKLAHAFNAIADECEQGTGLVYPETMHYDLANAAQPNPCVVYRAEICGYYSTAERLAALVKHLYNGAAHPVRLDNLLSNADERHAGIAIDLVKHYAEHGENCIYFMDLARHLVERDQAAAERAAAEADE